MAQPPQMKRSKARAERSRGANETNLKVELSRLKEDKKQSSIQSGLLDGDSSPPELIAKAAVGRRRRIRVTVLLLILFTVFGIVTSVMYRLRGNISDPGALITIGNEYFFDGTSADQPPAAVPSTE